jgi:DNA (cytosine-5)-methyltransferase 1
VTDHVKEAPLNEEELRMNRDAKTFHPVYNNMPFPDPADRPVRTITATCTRVSRESVIIDDPEQPGTYRRLTIRERALLQGFPINFTFFADRHGDKAKMVGNAIPPIFTYLVAHSVKGTKPAQVTSPAKLNYTPVFSLERGPSTPPESQPGSYPNTRRFRAAIPNLRFKSGVRFELANHFTGEHVEWRVDFYYGTSKKIIRVPLDETVWENLEATGLLNFLQKDASERILQLEDKLAQCSPDQLQATWSHRARGCSPYELVDEMGAISTDVSNGFNQLTNDWMYELVQLIINLDSPTDVSVNKQLNAKKLSTNSARILSGMVIGCIFNGKLSKDRFDTTLHFKDAMSTPVSPDQRTENRLVAHTAMSN